MRQIAIIGAGQAGLYLGMELLNAGYAVTLFSDRAPEAILNSKPMATPILYNDALQLERKLGLNFWDEQSPGLDKVRNYLCDPEGNIALVLSYNLEQRWQAVDQRLKFPTWMREFEKRGGKLIIQPMTSNDLEDCTQNYDLVVVAVGRGSFSLFERDLEKSIHDKPLRHLGGVIVTGVKRDEDDLFTHKITTIPGVGEVLQCPFYAKDKGFSYVLAFEACPGGAMDRFGQVENGQELLEISQKLVQEFTPWDYKAVENIELSDRNAWLCGAITPTVRKPIGRLPNGAIVMGIGDAVILNDPLAGQGANSATKMAHLVAQRIVEHGNQRFDADWIQAVFDEFWQYSQHANALTNSMLMPGAHVQDIMIAAAQNPDVANDVFKGINHPPSLFPWFFNPEEAKKYLEQKNGLVMANC